jgi:hypothetical protein
MVKEKLGKIKEEAISKRSGIINNSIMRVVP